MMGYSLKEIAEIIGASIIGDDQAWVSEFSIDTRRIGLPARTLFFAIKTEMSDGHDFVAAASEAGLVAAVVEKEIVGLTCAQLIVVDVIGSLQKLARHHRLRFDIPVVGITGSNGKTMVKEWLNQLCSAHFNICRSPRSYNSQLGVALSLLQLNEQHELAIIEAGISMPGEMERLFEMIQPTLGVFTHLGHAHLTHFGDVQSLQNEKMKLFQKSIPVIAPREIPLGGSAKYWGDGDDCHWIVEWLDRTSSQQAQVKWKGEKFLISLPFSSSIESDNAMTAVATALELGVPLEHVLSNVESLSTLDMRMEQLEGLDDSVLINDAYSFDVSSLKLAMQDVWRLHKDQPHFIVLSDMPQGDIDEYVLIQEELKAYHWDKVFLIGENWSRLQVPWAHVYPRVMDFLNDINRYNWNQSVILIKGARSSRFEEIVHRMQAKNHLTRLEINLESIEHNLNYYRSLLKPKVKMMVMIKADAYGLGAIGIAQSQAFQHVDYIGVAYVDEGVALRKAGISLPIMIMNPEQQSVKALLDYHLEPEVFSLDAFKEMLKHKDAIDPLKPMGVHLKVDTGMRRLGIEPGEWEAFESLLEKRADIRLLSVLTHLAASEDSKHDAFTEHQLSVFQEIVLKAKLINPQVVAHAANSGAIERWPAAQLDMVRLGIGLYGTSSRDNIQLHLKTTCDWKTHVSQIKTVHVGESVGYGRSDMAQKEMQLAVIPVGYADGLPRMLSNGVGKVFINGNRCPIIGRVCMDMTMVDVTGIRVKAGD
jgi:alanine racemase